MKIKSLKGGAASGIINAVTIGRMRIVALLSDPAFRSDDSVYFGHSSGCFVVLGLY